MAKDLEYYVAQARRIAEHREASAEKEIRKIYKAMLKDLQGFMTETYVQLAEDDKLTYAMLQKAGYDARFLQEIEQRINNSTPAAAKKLQELVEQTYTAAYEGMVKGVEKAAQGIITLDEAFENSIAITPEQIKAAVQNPVDGLTLSDKLEKNRKEIIYSIKRTVGVGLMNGDRYTTMAKRIAEQIDNDYTKAIRIARTETHRVREAGNHDAAMAVDNEMKNGTSGMRMVKTWRTMKDERVRPQQRRKGKKGWKTTMRGSANHMKMEDVTVLADESFDLGGGVKAMAPGNSGDASNDINCRCYASYEMMTDEQFFKKTGKHFTTAEKGDRKQDFTDFSDYDLDTLRNTASLTGKEPEEVERMSEEELRNHMRDVYRNGRKEAAEFRANHAIPVGASAEEITKQMRRINDVPFVFNDSSEFQKYSLIKLSDDLPEIVDSLDGYEGITLYRGVRDNPLVKARTVCDMTKYYGDQFVGGGAYGDGTYFTNLADGIKAYGTDGVVRAKIKPGAKVITYDEARRAAAGGRVRRPDISIWAVENGYDVIIETNVGTADEIYYNVLRRSALWIEK